MTSAFSAIVGWTLFGGLTLSIGAVVSRWLILPRAFAGGDPSVATHRQEAARIGLAGAVLAMVGVALYFARQLQEFRDPFVPWTEDATLLLTGTAWGATWTQAAVAVVLLAIAFAIAVSGRSFGWWLATPLVLALGVFPGLTGHAAGVETLRGLSLVADAAHVWAAGAWIGGLAVLLHLEREARGDHGADGSLLPALVPCFSRVAIASVAVLALTGLFASWTHIETFGALVSTAYGRTLLLKLGLVGVVLALGARNFRRLTPNLGTGEGNEAMRRSATLELLVGELVLIVTAVLVRTAPMGH